MTEREDQARQTVSPLIEGRDYYFENALMVLTSEYLRRRGYCCGNICRHCPYTKEEQASAASKKKLV